MVVVVVVATIDARIPRQRWRREQHRHLSNNCNGQQQQQQQQCICSFVVDCRDAKQDGPF